MEALEGSHDRPDAMMSGYTLLKEYEQAPAILNTQQ